MLLHLSDHNFENNFNMLLNVQYIVSFWLVQESAELAAGVTGCGKVAGGWCEVAWNFSMTGQLYLQGWTEDTKPNLILSLHRWLAPSLPIENCTSQKPGTALYQSYILDPEQCSQYSDYSMGWTIKKSLFNSQKGQNIFIICKASRPAPGPI